MLQLLAAHATALFEEALQVGARLQPLRFAHLQQLCLPVQQGCRGLPLGIEEYASALLLKIVNARADLLEFGTLMEQLLALGIGLPRGLERCDLQACLYDFVVCVFQLAELLD